MDQRDRLPVNAGSLGSRALVLVVDDEATVLATVRSWLEQAGYQVACAQSREQALGLIRHHPIAVALIDYRLGADDGVTLGRLLLATYGLRFVLFSGFLTPQVVFAAAKAGASGVISKPLSRDTLLAALEESLLGLVREPSRELPTRQTQASVVEDLQTERADTPRRWAQLIMRACAAETDLSTAEVLGRAIGISPSSFRDLCHVCGIRQPSSARDLARFLRALSLNRRRPQVPLKSHFAVADERTLRRLFRQAGLRVDACDVRLRSFLLEQKFVRIELPWMGELAHLAANSPLFY